jgi:tRNA threonylcarbamoyladenosine modification (KEOPS) complex  Pcc1 subunit
MPPAPAEPVDLLDLKLLPAWLKEPADARSYEHYKGEDQEQRPRRPQGGRRPARPPAGRERAPRRPGDGKSGRREGERGRPKGRAQENRPQVQRPDRERGPDDRERDIQALAARVSVRFLPHAPVLHNVIAQIQSNPVAYSVFALARLFLEKPERYDVHLAAQPECSLYQLGENPAVSADQQFLESGAFRIAQGDFYKVEVVQSEPIKGNFSSVARCRASGLLLGPTNHHGYQPRLRSLYEQRFSRRMSFPDYQRQIEIVTDPGVVEQWKEDARKVTTFTAAKEETPVIFKSAAEAERHFRQNYLPGLIRPVAEQTMDGVTSRQLPDRTLRRVIEDAWSKETRSPSQMMQELSNKLREAGLQIFRHRKGMLFVISVHVRPFAHKESGVSPQIQAILQIVRASAGIGRKELADKILIDIRAEDAEARKMALASDLRWLISEGYVIEFNDGSLDLPRAKVKPVGEKAPRTAEKASETEAEAPPAKDERELVGSPESRPTEKEESGGS